MSEKIVLVDAYSLMYRAFHALPLLDNGSGEYTNAIFGFMSMFIKVLHEEKPDYCIAAFDEHAKTFRHEAFSEYKAGRAPTPDEMRPQIPLIREMLADMGIKQISVAGYEADDILGTVTRICEENGIDALVVTGDRDSYQLAGEHTTILYTKKGITDTERVTPAWIKEKYGVAPVQLIDIKGLMGDTSDNIPGVPGVGEKTAVKLICEYETLENVLDNAETNLKGALRTRIIENTEKARLSKYLARIDRFAPIEFIKDECRMGSLRGALPLMRRLNLNTLIKRVTEIEQPAPEAPVSSTLVVDKKVKPETPTGASELAEAIVRLFESPVSEIAVCIGEKLSLACSDGRAITCEIGGDLITQGLSDTEIVSSLSPMYSHSETHVIMHNIKAFPGDIKAFAGRSDDTMLMSYVLNPQKNAQSLADACANENVDYDDVCPARSALALYKVQRDALERDGLYELYTNVELPLAFVLRDMEETGFCVDAEYLKELGVIYEKRIAEITESIQSLAGEKGRGVNLNSPKQLSKLLFEDLGIKLPKGKKGTGAEVLEELADEHPICGLILEYRKYQKLNSTYITGLLQKRTADGRIHTSFEQAVTGTGRISSREPNLQNIPVRTELGREIRRAFIAPEGSVLVDADYSQIELRVLAHMSGDTSMRDAFLNEQDIHARTASEIFSVPLNEVTKELRSHAKAVNFGIVYGISDFGLAKNTGVSRREAAEFIDRYFSRYPDIKKYMDSQVDLGKTQGYVETLLKRRRYLPELTNPSYAMRSFGERAAMNSPIQGTAADIIKLAMVKVHESLKNEGLRARLILQVHDELIIECPEGEVERVKALLKDGMESVMSLSVPLKTELSTGGNWNECK